MNKAEITTARPWELVNSWSGPELIAVLSLDSLEGASIQLRFVRPYELMAGAYELAWSAHTEGKNIVINLDELRRAKVIIIHRSFPCRETASLLEEVFQSGKPVIYETDDLLDEMPDHHPLKSKFTGVDTYVLDVVKRASAVVVSTETMRQHYARFNSRVFVFPNFLSLTHPVSPNIKKDTPVTLFYTGTMTHKPDLDRVAPVFFSLAEKYADRIGFTFMGCDIKAFHELPNYRYIQPERNYSGYLAKIASRPGDIGLAPLEDHLFNRAKSNIKWLEYSLLGIPGVYSALPPYTECIEHGKTGLLVADLTQWEAALSFLIEHPEARLSIGQAARAQVEQHFDLNTRGVGKIWDVCQEIFKDDVVNLAETAKDELSDSGLAEASAKLKDDKFYLGWMKAKQEGPAERMWQAETMATWDSKPSFHLAIVLLPGREPWLVQTIDSLQLQGYGNWKLTVVAFTPLPPGLSLGPGVQWREVGDEEDSTDVVNGVLSAFPADWVGCVEAGDRIAAHGFFSLALTALAHPDWQVVYTDEDLLDQELRRSTPQFKPDFNPDLLRSSPYVGGLTFYKRDLYMRLNGLSPAWDGAQEYDLVLRAFEQVGEAGIGHVADVLYHRFVLGGHCMQTPEGVWQQGREALEQHLGRMSQGAVVSLGDFMPSYRVEYPLIGQPLVSIIIPTKDQYRLLKGCVESILAKTEYTAYEILLIDNGTTELNAINYLAELSVHENVRVLSYPSEFNFAAMNNMAARHARGEFLLLLNNDTEVRHGDWLSKLLRHGQRQEVGVVGAKLLNIDNTIQHAGVVLGVGVADHIYKGLPADEHGQLNRARLTQNYSAVTGACMLIRKDLYTAVGGLDQAALRVLFNDIDLCLKIRRESLLVVWCHDVVLTHVNSVSIRANKNVSGSSSAYKRAENEYYLMYKRWLPQLSRDRAYNRNLSLQNTNAVIEADKSVSLNPEWRPRPRVIACPADYDGCGEYRILAPMRALAAAGKVQGWSSDRIYSNAEVERFKPDSMIFQRQIEDHQLDAIRYRKTFSDVFRIFELDDLLGQTTEKNPHNVHLQGDEAERIEVAVHLCDRFVTTSEVIADAYGKGCNDIKIVPNYLDAGKWGRFNPRRRQTARPRVGWAGGTSHVGDLEMMIDVFRILRQEVDWVLLGECPAGVRPYLAEWHAPVHIGAYPAKLASLDLDLAIAPLEYHPFNEAKSSLRLLEYGVLGYPVICTDIKPFAGAYPVTRVKNTVADWVDAIRVAVADRDALVMQGDRLRAHISEHWMLEDNLDNWLQAWLP